MPRRQQQQQQYPQQVQKQQQHRIPSWKSRQRLTTCSWPAKPPPERRQLLLEITLPGIPQRATLTTTAVPSPCKACHGATLRKGKHAGRVSHKNSVNPPAAIAYLVHTAAQHLGGLKFRLRLIRSASLPNLPAGCNCYASCVLPRMDPGLPAARRPTLRCALRNKLPPPPQGLVVGRPMLLAGSCTATTGQRDAPACPRSHRG